jgi:hypothetical protein
MRSSAISLLLFFGNVVVASPLLGRDAEACETRKDDYAACITTC